MGLLAQDWTRRNQELLMVGAMRPVAIEAVVAHGSMLEQEGSALLGMTLVTGLVDGIRFKQWIGDTTMRVMAIDTAQFTFRQGHVGAALKLRPLLLVASETGFVDAASGQQASGGEIGHRVVTITAGNVKVLVDRINPVDAGSALMALHAYCIEPCNGRNRSGGKTHDPARRKWIPQVLRARSMARLTASGFLLVAGCIPEDFRVNGMDPPDTCVSMAPAAGIRTQIFAARQWFLFFGACSVSVSEDQCHHGNPAKTTRFAAPDPLPTCKPPVFRHAGSSIIAATHGHDLDVAPASKVPPATV
jgi:hypothetical protein